MIENNLAKCLSLFLAFEPFLSDSCPCHGRSQCGSINRLIEIVGTSGKHVFDCRNKTLVNLIGRGTIFLYFVRDCNTVKGPNGLKWKRFDNSCFKIIALVPVKDWNVICSERRFPFGKILFFVLVLCIGVAKEANRKFSGLKMFDILNHLRSGPVRNSDSEISHVRFFIGQTKVLQCTAYPYFSSSLCDDNLLRKECLRVFPAHTLHA